MHVPNAGIRESPLTSMTIPKKKKLEKDCSMESHKVPRSYPKIFKKPYSYLSCDSQQDQKNTTLKLSWFFFPFIKKPVGMVQKYPIRWHQFFHGELNPPWIASRVFIGHNKARWSWRFDKNHPSVVTPCPQIATSSVGPGHPCLESKPGGPGGRRSPGWTWHITQSMDQWCTLPETDIAPGILVSFWDRLFSGAMLVSGSVFTYMNGWFLWFSYTVSKYTHQSSHGIMRHGILMGPNPTVG